MHGLQSCEGLVKRSQVEDVHQPLALVLSPSSPAEWSVDRLEAEIQSVVGTDTRDVKTLVIVDNLEMCFG